MDVTNWKRILLKWINQLGFLERQFYNLEQSDIESFFNKFRERMKNAEISEDITIFLKDEYPDFEPNLDDENALSSADYMYVYSLILHFSCVKCPEGYFHEVCQNLPDQYQHAIAGFFKQLLEKETFTKSTLRHAIAAIAYVLPLPNSNTTRFESPHRTPRPNIKFSPQTPKTEMLDEKTRELQLLRAQLDTERYEKGFLEVQLKQNEEKISKLVDEKKKHLAVISELRNNALSNRSDHCSPNKSNGDDQVNKRLRKSIAQKEEEVVNLNEKLNSLKEEKSLLHQKLTYSNEQVFTCLDKIKELDAKINDLSSDLQQKDLTIKYLTETKTELEQFINETRTSCCSQVDNNTSIECLDISLSRTTNSSGSIGSPENLGVSVIDIQLREKELENNLLREEIKEFQLNDYKLSKHICDIIVTNSEIFDICNENFITNESDELSKTFLVFENYLIKLIENYKLSTKELNIMQNETMSLSNQNTNLVQKINELEGVVKSFQHKIETLELNQSTIVLEKDTLEEQLNEFQDNIKNLKDNIQNLEETDCQKAEKIKMLENEIEVAENKQTDLNNVISDLKQFNSELTIKLEMQEDEMKIINEQFDEHKQTSEEQITRIQLQFEQKEGALKSIIGQLGESRDHIAALKNSLANITNTYENKKNVYETKIKELQLNLVEQEKLAVEKNELESAKADLSEQLSKTKLDFDNSVVEHKLKLDELFAKNTELKISNEQLLSQIDTMNLYNEKLINKLDCSVKNIRDLESKLSEEISRNNTNKTELENTVEWYKAEAKQMANEKLEMCKKLEHLTVTIEKLKEDNKLATAELENNNEDTKKTLSTYQERIKELNCDKMGLATALKETENNLKELTDYHKLKLDELNTLKDTYNETNLNLNNELTNLKLTLNAYQSDIDGINQIRALFESEKQELFNKLAEKDEKIEEFNQKFQNAFEQNTKLIKNFNTENEGLTAKIIESKNEVEQTKNLMQQKSKEFENLVKFVIEQLKNNIEITNLNFDKITSLDDSLNYPDPIATLKNKFNHIISYINYLKEINNEKNAQIKILSESLNSFKLHLENSQMEILNIRENITNDSNTINIQFKNEILRLHQDLDSCNQTNERLSRENCNLLKTLSDLEQKIMENSSCTQKALTFEKHNGELLMELKNVRHELLILSEKNAFYDNENNQLIKKCEEIEAVHKDCERTLQDLRDNLKKSAEECKNVISDLKLSIDTKDIKIQELLDERMTYLINLDSLKDEKELLFKQLCENTEESKRRNEEMDRIQEKYCDVIKNFDKLNMENTQLKYDNSLKTEKLESKSKELELTRKDFDELSGVLIQIQHSQNQKNANYMDLKTLTEQLGTAKHYLEKKETDLLRKLELETAQNVYLNNELEAIKEVTNDYNELARIRDDERKKYNENVSILEHEARMLRQELHEFDNIQAELKEHTENYTKLEENYLNKEIEIEQLKENLSLCEKNLQCEITKQAETQKQLQRYESDNSKFIESLDTINQRLEKQSIKLGESQAKVSKLEKEIEMNNKSISVFKSNLESTQNENTRLKDELKEYKDKTSKFDHTYDVLLTKHTNLEKLLKELQNNLAKSQELEQKLKNTMKSLICEKDHQVLRIERLNSALNEANNTIGSLERENQTLEKDNVQLNLEIGGLNKTIVELKDKLDCEVKEITTNLVQMKELNKSYKDDIQQLQTEKDSIIEEYVKINDCMTNMSLRCQIIEDERNSFEDHIKQLENMLKSIQDEKDELANEHANCSKVVEKLNVLLSKEKHFEATRLELTNKIDQLEENVENKIKAIDSLNWQIETLKAAVVIVHPEEVTELKTKLEVAELSLKKETETCNKLKSDISIYHAKLCKNRQQLEENERKWSEEKQQLTLLSQNADDRIKDNRLELEGKLEKMKLKMKTLYNDEVTKLKNKHERDVDALKTNLELLKKKNFKYEEHVNKLSKQILEYNETIMELKKQNTFMETRLKDMNSVSSMGIKKMQRPQTIHIASSNLRMEDEEGELFNNTYLADLKEGRLNEIGQDSISVQELQYRNSLAPPHLKSTYLAQYQDHQLAEEDIKDGIPMSFDDSMSSLLNTGQRKKASGATSYKRPGPPTPSKNAGRLSFGGCIELPREILKESHDSNVVSSTKRTPAKFKLFSSSKFSSYKDEINIDHQRDSCFVLNADRLSYNRRKQSETKLTSTPRTSKVHYDHRRQLHKFLLSDGSQSDLTDNDGKISSDCVSSSIAKRVDKIVCDKSNSERVSSNWRQQKTVYTTESTSDSNSPLIKGNDVLHKRKPLRERRVSLYLKGNIYSKSKLPSQLVREQIRKKAKYQRGTNFNIGRQSLSNSSVRLRKSSINKKILSATIRDSVDLDISRRSDNFDYNDNILIDNTMVDGGLKKFEQLLNDKESHAPFEIAEINFLSTSLQTNSNSRTLYGSSVIFNQKLPNVRTTVVRKSSIYLNPRNGRAYVLYHDSKLSFTNLDLIWQQLNMLTKIIFCILFGIPTITIFVLLLNFFKLNL